MDTYLILCLRTDYDTSFVFWNDFDFLDHLPRDYVTHLAPLLEDDPALVLLSQFLSSVVLSSGFAVPNPIGFTC